MFTGNYDNMQRLLAQLIGNTPTTLVINAGKARASGAETEAGLVVTQRLRLEASFGYTCAQYLEFTQRLLYDTQVRRRGLGNLHRAAVVRQPAAARRRRLAQRARVQRHQRLQPPGLVGLLNARAALTSAGAALQATLFGTNLTDKRYAYTGGTIVNPGTIPVASWQAAADRRLYGVEVAYRFSTPR